MITDVEIYGQSELDRKCKNHDFPDSILISIGDPHWPLMAISYDERIANSIQRKFKSILRLEFFDETEVSKVPKGKPKRLPRKSDIEKAIKYFERYKNYYNKIVIHCRSGVSRSTAIGLLVLYLIHKDEDKAIEIMKEIRPYAVPHEGILKIIDNMYETKFAEKRFDILRNWKGRIQSRMKAKSKSNSRPTTAST